MDILQKILPGYIIESIHIGEIYQEGVLKKDILTKYMEKNKI